MSKYYKAVLLKENTIDFQKAIKFIKKDFLLNNKDVEIVPQVSKSVDKLGFLETKVDSNIKYSKIDFQKTKLSKNELENLDVLELDENGKFIFNKSFKYPAKNEKNGYILFEAYFNDKKDGNYPFANLKEMLNKKDQ